MKHSRRDVVKLAGTTFAGGMAMAESALTARQVVERIQKNIGVAWRSQTVDTIKIGDPETPVKGIATSFMSTFDVLQRAAAAGKNFVITHEPTFWNHQDQTADYESNAVFQAKRDFIGKNNIVVFRFHDHWHMRRPDGIQTGIIEDLGWDKHRDGESTRNFTIPEANLSDLARQFQKTLKIRTMRVLGDSKLKVKKVTINAGYNDLNGVIRSLQQSDIVVLGECREWEGVEYTQDAIASGAKKGLIILGHAVSEDPGMTYCAKWLKSFIAEVPIEAVPTREPFWTVSA